MEINSLNGTDLLILQPLNIVELTSTVQEEESLLVRLLNDIHINFSHTDVEGTILFRVYRT